MAKNQLIKAATVLTRGKSIVTTFTSMQGSVTKAIDLKTVSTMTLVATQEA